jgi:hypothetical protein
LQLLARGRGRRLEAQRAVLGLDLDVDAIKAEDVELDVHVEARPRPVHPLHRQELPPPDLAARCGGGGRQVALVRGHHGEGATGKTVVEWIIAGRLAEARNRLLHTDEMIDVITERVGYADPTHFIRLFRRTHDATPAAWRARQRALRTTS